MRYILENAETIADEALFVPLSDAQVDAQMRKFVDAHHLGVHRNFTRSSPLLRPIAARPH